MILLKLNIYFWILFNTGLFGNSIEYQITKCYTWCNDYN